MRLVVITILIVALCVVLLSFNILRRKEFPQFDVGGNEEMRRRGIRCFKEEDAAMHGRVCPGGEDAAACKDCNFKNQEKI